MSGAQNLLLGNVVAATSTDPYFNYTTLLLPGNGTNGAQNNTFLDSSTNAFSITRNGNTTQGTFSPFSQTGWSNYFDGSGDYLQLADSTDWDLSGDYTIECWIYVTSIPSSPTFFQLGESSNYLLWYISSSGNTPTLTGSASITASTGISLNTWNHLALVRSGSGSNNTVMYLNGVNVGQTTNTTSFTGSANNGVRIGAEYPTGYVLTGYLSNFSILKGTAKYTGAFTPSTTPLSASATNQKLLTCSSNRFVDSNTATTAKTITVNGNPSVQAFSPFNPTAAYSAATNGGSGYFDGSGDYLSIADNTALDLGTGDFTIEGWVYMNSSISDNAGIVSKRDSSTFNTGDWRISYRTATKKITFADDVVTEKATPAVDTNGWVHFAIVRSGTTLSAYANGVRGDSVTDSTNLDNSNPVEIGINQGSAAFNGYISGVRILKGTAQYSGTTYTVPTAPFTAITNTSLLCNFTNAGIIDNTAKNDLETVGNAQISTTQSKFGGSSMYFDGTGDWLSIPSSPNLAFGTGDFTIEFWVYYASASANYILFDGRGTAITNTGICIFTASDGTFYVNKANGSLITTTNPSATTWHHIAFTRSGSSNKLFIDGTQAGGTATDSTDYSTSYPIGIGNTLATAYQASYNLNGYIDDLRITKGVARYTANFTPPTAAFPLL